MSGEAPEGPRAKMLRRNKAMVLDGKDMALEGAERKRREEEAWEARQEGWKGEADLVALRGGAMEAGLVMGRERAVGADGGGLDEALEVEAERPADQQGSPPGALSRRELLDNLRQRIKRVRSEERGSSAERTAQRKKRRW